MGIVERKQREKEKRKEEIIVAAYKVFSTKGFNRATVEEIASKAELSPGTLYLYFKNKEELYTSLAINLLKYLAIEIEKVVDYDLPVEKKIECFLEIFIDLYNHDPNVLISLFHLQSGEVLHNLSDEIMQELKKYSTQAHGAIVAVIKEGINSGIFIDENPVALADLIWASYSGVVLWLNSKHLLNKQKNFVRSTLETAFEIIVQGLKTKREITIFPREECIVPSLSTITRDSCKSYAL